MGDFFELPNLPLRGVRLLIAGEAYCERLAAPLMALGVQLLSCPKNPYVDERLAYHADLSVFHLGGRRFVLAPYLKGTRFTERLASLGAEICFSELIQAKEYPHDAGLCALNTGRAVFSNRRHCDPAIITGAANFVNVAQGYAKCAVCLVTDSAAITADAGMAAALRNNGFEVLQISADGVLLEGFSQGFIGGAAFKLSSESLAFTGSLDLHPDKAAILNFLQNNGVEPVFLTDGTVFDIGSIIPVL